jgi:hypothetical protein
MFVFVKKIIHFIKFNWVFSNEGDKTAHTVPLAWKIPYKKVLPIPISLLNSFSFSRALLLVNLPINVLVKTAGFRSVIVPEKLCLRKGVFSSRIYMVQIQTRAF